MWLSGDVCGLSAINSDFRFEHSLITLGSLRTPLSVIAYNRGNLCRRLVLPKKIDNWSLTSPMPLTFCGAVPLDRKPTPWWASWALPE